VVVFAGNAEGGAGALFEFGRDSREASTEWKFDIHGALADHRLVERVESPQERVLMEAVEGRTRRGAQVRKDVGICTGEREFATESVVFDLTRKQVCGEWGRVTGDE
jgi:hypothetical protein